MPDHEKTPPFAPLVPNADTIEAMKEARRGDLPQFANVEDLVNDLRADDSSGSAGSRPAPEPLMSSAP